jgi:hypothetical protein
MNLQDSGDGILGISSLCPPMFIYEEYEKVRMELKDLLGKYRKEGTLSNFTWY